MRRKNFLEKNNKDESDGSPIDKNALGNIL